MLWLLAFHIIFMVSWFAGLFYLPRLFVYHAMSEDAISRNRFKIMERKLYYFIMTPAAILTAIFGLWLMALNLHIYWQQAWIHYKLMLVLLLYVYQVACGWLVQQFKHDCNPFSATFYRWFNEIPTLLLIAIVLLAVLKP